MKNPLSDQQQREQALNDRHSFIVQAPAGSGKTELLMQRYLMLLTKVEQPEEILAITFTRKAAAEMRMRILLALQTATLPGKIALTQELALAVLARDQALHWHILENPERLRIQTIDSFCNYLAQHMPLLTEFGAQPTLMTEGAHEFYRLAAQRLLNTLETDEDWVPSLKNLLLHLDNDFNKAEKLFTLMLARRDQWLPHIMATKNSQQRRAILEEGLKNINLEILKNCCRHFPEKYANEIIALARYAAGQLKNQNIENEISHCYDLAELPKPALSNKAAWLGLATLLLRKDGSDYIWRKTVQQKQGFPTQDKDDYCRSMKQRMLALLAHLREQETLQQTLIELFYCPAPHYTEQQWQVVNALVELLPVLTAQLILLFREQGQVDFIEMNARALQALGSSEAPTDIALYLDHRFKHILVDEFQDTSFTQYRLLQALTHEWQPQDGKTLFLVGDPMQSIYRFRQAEVGLFLMAKRYGINQIKFSSLTLTENFRSQANIVNWLNNNFNKIFPTTENIATGAVCFTRAIAQKSERNSAEVSIKPFINATDHEQAQQVIEIIEALQQKYPQETIAILVRTRLHLKAIVALLKEKQIAFQGVKIDKLTDYPLIQDLLALTRALLHPADRIAWLSLLRAPWCGLCLADLHAIASQNKQITLWQRLQDIEKITAVSENGKIRLQRFVAIIANSLAKKEKQNLSTWLENTWRALGGPACVNDATLLAAAKVYFELVETHCDDYFSDLMALEKKIDNSYMPAIEIENARLQIMTIHNAKGLEFDHVILPYLERIPRRDEESLLLWSERTDKNNQTDLILAPIKSPYVDKDDIYNYLRYEENKKQHYEITRLLYVAMTRAKNSLHLLGNISAESVYKVNEPIERSFLQLLWPEIKHLFLEKLTHTEFVQTSEAKSKRSSSFMMQRLKLPSPLIELPVPCPIPDHSSNIIQRDNSCAKAIGIIVHRWLQRIAIEGLAQWNSEKILKQQSMFKKQLTELYMTGEALTDCITQVTCALQETLNDPRGCWILKNHKAAHNEFPLTLAVNNTMQHLVIDRTFVDENNQRWIIDYKTSKPLPNEDIKEFLEKQKAVHWEQLTLYANAMQQLQPQSIRLGLYFPLISGWQEWETVTA